MSDLEEEMRRALFGSLGESVLTPPLTERPVTPKPKAKSLSPKIRVTMKVSKEFEGATELFVYEADTLSTLTAEIDAKAAARKKKFKYFEVVSVQTI
ncbi:hypothetical protein ACIQAL_09280 [Pseudomonas sp. NPDC088368]|uniref:hypothetical protein n=1 Tax=Pseudomonas sp. NPDC088368 TaxID=3364453 RepID=UPI0038223181